MIIYWYLRPAQERDIILICNFQQIHVHVRRHEFANVPEKPEEVDQWLRELWYEKEKILAKL